MSKVSGSVPFVAAVDRSSRVPLHRQLYDGLRGAILSGRLAAGTRLPSTRELAAGLGVSRNTVMGAFLPLLAEGYLEGRVGSGTYVAKSLPENLLRPASGIRQGQRRVGSGREISKRGCLLAATPATVTRDLGPPRAFRPGVPALAKFPWEV